MYLTPRGSGSVQLHSSLSLLVLIFVLLSIGSCNASAGDRLPEFKECVEVCKSENCGPSQTPLPVHLRLLFWTCPAECDYTCQHIVTERRLNHKPPVLNPIVQYHGKWPFHRILGVQEPCSVIFSAFNFAAHQQGMAKIRDSIPSRYPLRPYYLLFGYFGLTSWIFSVIFHTRDFNLTEKLDYFAAGASVLYGLYYTPIRIFRLDQARPSKAALLRLWTMLCLGLYAAHVLYLTAWSWDYSYNMAANVAVGIMQNLLWSWFSIKRYRRLHKPWATWPGLIVAWLILAMSLELLDFPPMGGLVDAHSLWHLGTVFPTVWWYNFLIKDAQEDMDGERLKA